MPRKPRRDPLEDHLRALLGDDITSSGLSFEVNELVGPPASVGLWRHLFTIDDQISVWLDVDEKDFTVRAIRIARAAQGGVRSHDLRAVPFGRLLQYVITEARVMGLPGRVTRVGSPGTRRVARRSDVAKAQRASSATEQRRAGRPPKSDDFYLEVARTALQLQGEGHARPNSTSAGLIAALADHFGHSPATVRGWIRGARKRKFLVPALPGRAGVAPGELYTEEDL